jgi:hypothetical protein
VVDLQQDGKNGTYIILMATDTTAWNYGSQGRSGQEDKVNIVKVETSIKR